MMMNETGWLLRKVRSDDRIAVLGVIEAAFDRRDEATLVERLWQENAIKVERLIEVGGEIAGYCCYSPITCKPELDGFLLGLGPLAVAPTHQNKGLGTKLVEDTLEICRSNKARLIAVLGDPDFYSRFGFEPAAEKKMSWAGFDAGDAFRILENDKFDATEIRTIHYHPAFDKLS